MFKSLKLMAFAGLMVILTASTLTGCDDNGRPGTQYDENGKPLPPVESTSNVPGASTSGAVGSVNGNTFTLTNNLMTSPVTVTVGPNTVITKSFYASASDLKIGQTMVVSGSKDSMGMVTATYITVPAPTPYSGNDTMGTLTKADGNTLTLTTPQNQQVTVTVGTSTPIYDTTSGTLSDIKVGSEITAQPKADANNQIAATKIVIKAPPRQTSTVTAGG